MTGCIGPGLDHVVFFRVFARLQKKEHFHVDGAEAEVGLKKTKADLG